MRADAEPVRPAIALFLGASAMFANMYATQAILPEIEHDLDVSPAATGLSITVVVRAWLLAAGYMARCPTAIGRGTRDDRLRRR